MQAMRRFPKISSSCYRLNSSMLSSIIKKRSTSTIPRFNSSSVSKDEVQKFSRMNAQWYDHKQNPLITMNPVRMSYILQVISKVYSSGNSHHGNTLTLEGLKALDVGCGGGLLSESLSKLGASVTAIDPSSLLVEAAMQRSQSQRFTIDYRPGMSIEEFAAEMQGIPNSELFDIICIMEVIEHTDNPQPIFQAISSLLKKSTTTTKGGILFLSTLNRTIKSYAIAVIGAEYVTRKVPVGTHSWNQFYSPQEVEAIAKTAGLKVLDVRGMAIVPTSLICGPLQWELDMQDVDVNWIASYTSADIPICN